MKTSFNVILLLISFCALSCNTATTDNKAKDVITSAKKISKGDAIKDVKPTELDRKHKATALKFTDLDIIFHSYISDEETGLDFSGTQKDTLYINLGFESDPIEGKSIQINKSTLENLKVEERYETSVGVYMSADEEYCELSDWKHYNSEWKSLKRDYLRRYIYPEYMQKGSPVFNIPIEEVEKEVNKRCGSATAGKLISVYKSPCEVFISTYYLRISGMKISDGKKVTILISFTPQIGC
ncbi:hypothetical protein ACFSJU_17445 [Paradesertivirga mongoliensis]|uniref:Lipoprotein n=1 Tax=Paradesertivirga mongoliensis TaxID=2100740 RepID=A0ABW4ZPY8_9SPHI|nr:hypothetical protein [Pedobacter mongoliensis]